MFLCSHIDSHVYVPEASLARMFYSLGVNLNGQRLSHVRLCTCEAKSRFKTL